ncbi:extracellular solute-binding protein [bacterium]|nr:extracellular solute-binding protein [bacterium]
MKKIILILFSIFLLTGCTQRKNDKELTFWTLQMNDFAPYINQIISAYENTNPNIKINWVDIPFSEGEKRTLAAIMSDSPPDLINLNPDFSALLAQKGTLWEIKSESLESFNQQIVESLKYNDRNYSIPWYATSAITIYNNDLFKKSEIIRIPKTYRELANISKKVKDKTGAYVYLPTITENDTMIKILNKYGIELPDDLTSKNSIEVFEMFKNLYQKDLIPRESITMTHREALEQFMAGKVIFFQGGANFLNIIKENAPSIFAQTAVSRQIQGPLGQNDFSVMNFVIPQKSKYKEDALKFCLFLTNKENQLNLAKLTNITSTNKEALKTSFYNDYSDIFAEARSISAKQINYINPVLKQKQNQKEINTFVNTTVQTILLNKNSTEKALKELKTKLENMN